MALTLQCDAQLNNAHTLRDTFKADAVVLITHIAGRAGTFGQAAPTMQADQVGNYSYEPCAFATVQVSQFLTPEYYFAHELGHLMGAEHDGCDCNSRCNPRQQLWLLGQDRRY